MAEITLKLRALHSAQAVIRDTMARFNVLDCGRRWGKDILGQDLVIDTALSGKPAAIFAPTYRMMLDNWRDIMALVQPIVTRANAQDHRIELVTNGYIDFWSLDSPDSARGRKYKRAFVNEAAMVRDLEYAWTHVIRPTLADYSGDALFASTPRGLNYFHTLWQRGQDGGEWKSWRFPTSANPHIKQSEIDAMKAELPARVFEQEIEAEFVEDGTYFRNVNACAVIDEPDDPKKHVGHGVVAGVDWGKKDDFTVVTAFCPQCACVVDWDRSNQIGYDFQRARLTTTHERWAFAGILPERNSIGEPNIEVLRNEGVPIMMGPDNGYGFNTLATTKPKLIEALALAIERNEIKVPRDYAIELMAYEIEMSKTGKPTWNAPTGQHDDRVISLALAYWAATHSTAQVWL